jgi:hypothetical protein
MLFARTRATAAFGAGFGMARLDHRPATAGVTVFLHIETFFFHHHGSRVIYSSSNSGSSSSAAATIRSTQTTQDITRNLSCRVFFVYCSVIIIIHGERARCKRRGGDWWSFWSCCWWFRRGRRGFVFEMFQHGGMDAIVYSRMQNYRNNHAPHNMKQRIKIFEEQQEEVFEVFPRKSGRFLEARAEPLSSSRRADEGTVGSSSKKFQVERDFKFW